MELNATLKDVNNALKDANAALKDLVTSLQNERAALLGQQTGHLTVAERPTWTWSRQLPQEILLRIFMETIPSDDDYELSVRVGPRTAWTLSVSTRKALTSVCKAWYGAASEALYADIALRRMGQISALARTLRAARAVYAPDPSSFIKRIRMTECIVANQCAPVVKADLAFILQHCSKLRTFEHHPHPLFERRDTPSDEPPSIEKWHNPMWFRNALAGTPGGALAERCASGLQHLVFADLGDEEQLAYLHHLLLKETHLVTLTLGFLASWTPTVLPTLSRQPPIILPYLEHLQVPGALLKVEHYLYDLWDVPNLRRLTVLYCDDVPRMALERFGKHLKYLNVVPGSDWKGEYLPSTLSMLPVLCPALEHLVLPNIARLNLPCVIASPTLRHLDIWGFAQQRRVVESMCDMGALPALHTIRMLPPHYPEDTALRMRLPLQCHPADVSEDATRVQTLPWGVRVLQTSWAVLRDLGGDEGDDVRFYSVPFDAEEDDGGSEYEPSWVGSEDEKGEEGGAAEDWAAKEEDDGTSWVSNSDSEASVGEDEDAPEAGLELVAASMQNSSAYDRKTVLEMFARSQEGDYLLDEEASL
ncbi:hypothetical protein TRAPUB_10618 [Trametes pubescens]|uniref:Uncharacterized protein n=1 Tax=Trametes pubescens TaxID=154538 RepID=A0A1M2VYZ1_TRAPU|nr:hypothetical protein TRAPUB_10618 [Trametes pubescens]